MSEKNPNLDGINEQTPTGTHGRPVQRRQAAEQREDESEEHQDNATNLASSREATTDIEATASTPTQEAQEWNNASLLTTTASGGLPARRQAAKRREDESEAQYNRRIRNNELVRKGRAEKKAAIQSEVNSPEDEFRRRQVLGRVAAEQQKDEANEQFAKRLRHNELQRQRQAKKKDVQGQPVIATNCANSLLIEVVQGDITQQGIEMVINAAHEQLIPGGGIDGAIRKVEGHVFNALTSRIFNDYCTRKNRTTLDYGDSLVVPASAIAGAKYVTHVVGPRLVLGASPSAGDRVKMVRTYQAAIAATERLGCQEIVIPFIGSGIFHYPMDQSQYLALFTVLRQLPKLKRIVFYHTGAPVVAAFAKLMGGNNVLRVDSQSHADALTSQLLCNVSANTPHTQTISNGGTSMEIHSDSEYDTGSGNARGVRKSNGVPQTYEEVKRKNLASKNEKARMRTEEERSEFNAKLNARRRVRTSTLNKVSSNVIPDERKDYSKIENSAPRQLYLQDPSVCIPQPVNQPKEIKELLTGSDPDSAHFRQARAQHVPFIYGRFQEAVAYNSSFAMGSLSYNREKTTKGPPFAKVNGMFHHLMGALETPEGKTPLFQQIYKYDVDEAARYRKMNPITGPLLQPKIAKQFKTVDDILGEMKAKKMKARNFCLVLRSPTEAEFHGADHPGTLERPRKELESFLYQELDDGGPPNTESTSGTTPISTQCRLTTSKRRQTKKKTILTAREDERNAPENQRSLFADSDEEQGDGEMYDLQEGMQGIEVSAQETDNAMDTDEWNAEDDRGNANTDNTMDDEELRDEDILETELQSDDPPDVNLLRHPEDERPTMEEDEDIDLEQTDVHYSPTGKNRKRQFVLSTLLLGQLYVIDQALRVIRQRNDNMRKHCVELRGATAQSLNFLNRSRRAQQKGFNLGYVFRVSRKAIGSAGWYRERFENAMAVIDKMGKPDLFITMTGDPNWPEIKDNLLPNTNWQSNPFLVNDVFYTKMQELIDDVVEKELVGPVVSFCYSVKFQKRGMPHMHMLLTLAGSKLSTPEDIDKHIWARIPPKPEEGEDNYEEKLRFHNNVVDKMVHTPCQGRPEAYCNQRPANARKCTYSKCTKCFPNEFAEFTSLREGGKVQHKRPNDGVTCIKKAGNVILIADNRYVVPCNPALLNKYACHINVEAVTRVNVVKYIYKYIYKGFHKALVQIVENFEIDNGAPTGHVSRTTVHASQNGTTGVMAPTGIKGTMKQWRDINDRIASEMKKLNIKAAEEEKLTAYDEAIMVEVFRQMTASEAAWIIQAYPLAGLSHTVKNLAVHDENEENIFFRKGEEEKAAGKAKSDETRSMLLAWFDLNREDPDAQQFTFNEIPLHYKFDKKQKSKWSKYIRRPTRVVVRVRPVSPRYLNKFAIRLLALHQKGPKSFEELRTVAGVVHANAQEAAKALGLMDSELEFTLAMADACKMEHPRRLRRLFATILVFGCPKDPLELWKQFEDEMYNPGMANQSNRARAMALYHIQWLLEMHSMTLKDFNLPECEENLLQRKDKEDAMDVPAMANVVDVEAEAKKLFDTLNQEQRVAFDRVMKAVEDGGSGREGNCFFLHGSGGCGKTYVYKALYYHFENVGVSITMVATTGIASTLLIQGTTAHRKFMLPLNLTSDGRSTVVHLKQNMRAKEDSKYSMLLENIGNGMQNGQPSNTVDLYPECLCLEEDEVIDFIYGGKVDKVAEIASSCVLTTLNAETTEINEKVLKMLPGEERVYDAIDTPMDGIGMQVPPEYFRNDMESGMPPFHLNLKLGSIVILLRNLNVLRGLCNGTRMEVIEMRDHIVVCKLISTKFAGKVVWIAKAKMTPADGNPKKAKYERFQFPLRLAYSMTINKAQGQTYDKVGIILRNNPFSHGQLYVALSRARKSINVRVYSSATVMTGNGRKKITLYNKVERSVLEDVDPGTLRSDSYVQPEPVEPLVQLFTPRKTKRTYNPNDFSTPSIQPRRKVSRTTPADVTSQREESANDVMEIDQSSLLPIDHGPHLLLMNLQLSCFLNTLIQCLRAVGPLSAAIIEGVGRGEGCVENVCGALNGLLMARGVADAHDLRQALASTYPDEARAIMRQENCVNEVLRRLFARIPATAKGLFTFMQMTRLKCSAGCFYRLSDPEECALIPRVVRHEVISLRALLGPQRDAVSVGCASCSSVHGHNAPGEQILYYEDVGAPFLIIMLSITDRDTKIDYSLVEGEDLDSIPFAGSTWKAVAMAEHHGRNKPGRAEDTIRHGRGIRRQDHGGTTTTPRHPPTSEADSEQREAQSICAE